MKIVLITGDGPEHHYVANRLARGVELSAIIVDHGKRIGKLDRVRQLYRRYTFGQWLSRAVLVVLRRLWKDGERRQRALAAILDTDCLKFDRPNLLRDAYGINTAESVQLVASCSPDVILVFGTGVVGKKVLSLARKLALNLHTGISPYYRGANCTFWPVHNHELHMLGATVHECTMELDGGKIFGTTGVHLSAQDGLFEIFARCLKAGTMLYVEKVQELISHGLEGTAQDFSLGKEYRAYMRGVRADWKVRREIKKGLVRDYVAKTEAADEASSVAVSAS